MKSPASLWQTSRRLAFIASLLASSAYAVDPTKPYQVSSVPNLAIDLLCPEIVTTAAERWKKSLELLDWVVAVTCEADPEIPQAEGTSEMVFEERVAHIRINPTAPDMAEVMLHELLHIWTGTLGENKSDLTDEQVVRVLTRLLLTPPKDVAAPLLKVADQ